MFPGGLSAARSVSDLSIRNVQVQTSVAMDSVPETVEVEDVTHRATLAHGRSRYTLFLFTFQYTA